jgi:hypothetical protein
MIAVSGQFNVATEISTTKKRKDNRVLSPRSRICRKPARAARAASTAIEYGDMGTLVGTGLQVYQGNWDATPATRPDLR